MEKGINVLKPKGIISYIVPNSWLKNLMFDKCRTYILEKTKIEIIIPNLENIFIEASVDTMIFIGVKSSEFNPKIQIGAFNKTDYYSKHTVDQNRFFINDRHIFDVEISKEAVSIFEKVKKQSISLSEISDITRGINPYDKYRGQSEEIIKNKLYHSDYKKDETFVPEIRGKHVNRYSFDWDGCSYVSYGDWLAAPREKKFFVGNRIICRQVLGKNLNCTFINSDFIIDQSVFIAKFDDNQSLTSNPLFILTQLTSKLIGYYFRYKGNEFDALFPKIKIGEYKELPVKIIENQKPFIEKADLMLSLNKEFQTEKNNFLNTLKEEKNIEKITKKLDAFYDFEYDILKKELAKQKVKFALGNENNEWREYFNTTKQKINKLQSQINQIDKKIDKMVYDLYELTAEEIEIVENSVK